MLSECSTDSITCQIFHIIKVSTINTLYRSTDYLVNGVYSVLKSNANESSFTENNYYFVTTIEFLISVDWKIEI